jgi:tRNA A37 methylthiotransferase MiaB
VVSEEMIKMKNVEGQRMDGRLAMTIAQMASFSPSSDLPFQSYAP